MAGDASQVAAPFSAQRELWSRWFVDLSRAMDGYMRSPAFLYWMQHRLALMTEARRFGAAAWVTAPERSKPRSEPARAGGSTEPAASERSSTPTP